MNPFETETMADLCLRQGHRDEALAIYRRVLARTDDQAARERIHRRISAIAGGQTGSRDPDGAYDGVAPRADVGEPPVPAPLPAAPSGPLPLPGVRARWSGDDLTIEWRLPPHTVNPGLEVLLVKQGPDGVVTETRAIDVDRDAGRITLTVGGLHLVRAAAGSRGRGNFVPLARD